MSQKTYSLLMRVSESLISLCEIGQRSLSGKAFSKETNFLLEWVEVKKEVQIPEGNLTLAQIKEKLGPKYGNSLAHFVWQKK